MLANWLYLFRLPPLTHNAQLKNFGTWGNSGVALARLALYADNGGSTPAPTGAPLATSPSFGLTDGQREFVATPTDLALSAGTVYWIAIVVNTGTTFRTATDGAQNGMRFPQQYGATDLQTRDGMQGQASGGLDWAVYIKIQDID
jgi:hypothetical protein